MKITIKISLLIALCTLLTGLSVGSRKSNATASQDENSQGAATVKAIEAAEDTSDKKAAFSSDTLILTVDSAPVYWPEFLFWLKYIGKYYKNYHKIDRITDWDLEQNGMPLSEFFLSTAVGYACKDRAIEAKAKELGIGLSVYDLEEIEEARNKNIRIYGSESEYRHIVASMYISEEVFNYLTKIDYLGNYLFEYLYGKKGGKCSDKTVSTYIEKQGYMCTKYIFLSDTDSEGSKRSAEENDQNYRLLGDILDRLDASENPLTLFDALMIKYGEDRTVLNYPDGRLFVSGAMGEEFERAYLKLKEKKFSGIVKSDEGYYVILRMPISPDMTADSLGNSLRYRIAYDHLFKEQVEAWSAKMKIEHEDAYYKIDVKSVLNLY